MRAITFAGATAYLITESPTWESNIELSADLPGHLELGLTSRETRRPLADNLRIGMTWTGYVNDVPGFRNCLQALTTEKVLCPLWPAWFKAGDTPPITADYYAVGDDLDIVSAADLPDDKDGYPLLVGKLSEIPDETLLTDEDATAQIKFIESSEYAVNPPSFAAPAGIVVGGANTSLFPFRPDWATAPKQGTADVDIETQSIGQGRETADAFYDQPARRGGSGLFTLANTEPWQLLSFFLDSGGFAGTFWLPGCVSDARLTADVAANATALPVDNVTARGENTAYLLDDLTNRKCVVVASSGAGQWNLTAQVGQAFEAQYTRVESLYLARFKTSKLTLKFKSPAVAQTSIEFRECPWETEVVSGETLGGTMGKLAVTAYAYTFSIKYPGQTVYYRYTDFESNLTCDGETFLSKPIEHGSITETCTLERQGCSIKSRIWTGNPLGLFIPFRLEWPLMLQIDELEVIGSNATVVDTVFYGEVTKSEADGPYIKAECKTMPSALDQKIPRRLLQPGCNWVGNGGYPDYLFSSQCGLGAANWAWIGKITSYDAATLKLTLHAMNRQYGAELNPMSAHYFAGGLMIIGGSPRLDYGPAAQYRRILWSTQGNWTTGGYGLAITIGTPLITAPAAEDAIWIFPGCDGTKETCKNKFNNLTKHGGFPFIPASNPSLSQRASSTSTGKK